MCDFCPSLCWGKMAMMCSKSKQHGREEGVRMAMVMVAMVVSVAADYERTSIEWMVPGEDYPHFYETLLDGKTFAVGDILEFKYARGAHNVVRVSEREYEACDDASSAVVYESGDDVIALTSPVKHYFICTVGDHCLAGQKLSVEVLPQHSSISPSPSAAASASASAPAPAPAPSSSSPSSIILSLTSLLFGAAFALAICFLA